MESHICTCGQILRLPRDAGETFVDPDTRVVHSFEGNPCAVPCFCGFTTHDAETHEKMKLLGHW